MMKISEKIHHSRILRFCLAVISGLLYFYASPGPGHIGWLAFFCLVPLIISLTSSKSYIESFSLGFFFNLAAYFLLVFWLNNISVLIWLGTSIIYSLFYYAPLGLLIYHFNKRYPLLNLLSIPALWTLAEWVKSRGLIGLPFGDISQSLYSYPVFIQSASLLGEYWISFLIVAVNVLILLFVEKKIFNKSFVKIEVFLIAAFVMILAGNLLLGFFQLHSHELAASSGIEHILIVNPEVGTDVTDKSKDASYSNYATSRLQQFIRPTEAYLDDKQNESPDLIVWGESAALHNVFQEQDGKVVYSENSDVKLLQDFIARNKKPVLLGAYIYRLDGGQTMFYNSAVLIDGNGRIQDYYNKNKLLFLGEYIPPYLKFLVPFADRLSLVRKLQSDKKTTFNNGGFSFVTPICYENGFNDFVRELILSGRMSDAIINMTDDADFADLRQAWQHMSVNVFRAIESGIPAIAAANFGVSGSVSSDGIITGPVLSGKGVLEVDIPLRGTGDLTFFLKHGNIFIGISFVYLCGLILFGPLILKKTKTKK